MDSFFFPLWGASVLISIGLLFSGSKPGNFVSGLLAGAPYFVLLILLSLAVNFNMRGSGEIYYFVVGSVGFAVLFIALFHLKVLKGNKVYFFYGLIPGTIIHYSIIQIVSKTLIYDIANFLLTFWVASIFLSVWLLFSRSKPGNFVSGLLAGAPYCVFMGIISTLLKLNIGSWNENNYFVIGPVSCAIILIALFHLKVLKGNKVYFFYGFIPGAIIHYHILAYIFRDPWF